MFGEPIGPRPIGPPGAAIKIERRDADLGIRVDGKVRFGQHDETSHPALSFEDVPGGLTKHHQSQFVDCPRDHVLEGTHIPERRRHTSDRIDNPLDPDVALHGTLRAKAHHTQVGSNTNAKRMRQPRPFDKPGFQRGMGEPGCLTGSDMSRTNTVKKPTAPVKTDASLDEAKTAVQDFQVRRLKRDFRDLRMSEEYGPFSEFFATEIYSARDFTERNESFRRLTGQFRHLLGDEIYHGLIGLLDLHKLTDELDEVVAQRILDDGIPLAFTEVQYEKIYRDIDNYDERVRQIEMIIESLHFTHHVSHQALIGIVLKSAKVATGLFSKDRTVGVLEHAYSTLKNIKDIAYLSGEVRQRELGRLDRIYGKA